MTPAKMFEGDLWVLASDAVQMAQNAYKNGQADEREACAKVCDDLWKDNYTAYACAEAIRARGQA
jgi:hypothetical protein